MRHIVTSFIIVFLNLPMSSQLFAQAQLDTVSIYELQYVSDPVVNDLSPLFGDTVVVKGLVMNGPRDLWIGARWSIYVVDPDSFPNPWSGFFVLQDDTNQINTNFGFLEPGMICYFTGKVDEFSNFSQLNVYKTGFYAPDPLIPVEIISTGNPLPEPKVLTNADLATVASAEQWESMWVRIENATMVNNNISGDWASFTDPSGETGYLAEYFNWFRDRLNPSGEGTYSWPAPGTNFNVVGFTRDESGSPGRVMSINPRDTLDLTILTNPPVISDVRRSVASPTSADEVEVSAVIVDEGTVNQAILNYSVDWGAFQQLSMTAVQDTFKGTIPVQTDGSVVRYFVTAEDNLGERSQAPGDTSMVNGRIYFYFVRDAGPSIRDIQYTLGYRVDASGYTGYSVTLKGVVMTDSTDFSGDLYMQDADSVWSGIWVNNIPKGQVKGDRISVTATIEENFNVTRMNNVSDWQLLETGVGAFDPVPVKTGDINSTGPLSEAYESVLIKFTDLTVTNPLPDAPSNFGEFSVDDGSGEIRVDDLSSAFEGNLNLKYGLNDQISEMIALGYYSFGNYKVLPRDSMDVIGHVSGLAETNRSVVQDFRLEQNYPNPFNPSTQITYQVAKPGTYTLMIYNILGQDILTLVNRFHNAGTYTVTWNGLNRSGQHPGSGLYFYRLQGEGFATTKKMLLLK